MQVGPGQVHSVVRSGVDRTSGRLPLQGDAQLFYIKPKLLVEAEGRIQAQYGLSTYCFCGEAEPRLLPNQSFWQQG